MWSLLPGPCPGLTSWLTGLATFLNQTACENGECYCWHQQLARTTKSWCSHYTVYRGQQDSTTGETTGRTAGVPSRPQAPTVPRHPALWGPTRGSRQTHMSFNLQSPMIPYYDPLKRGTVQITLGATLCVYHMEVLGCWAELLWIWLKAAIVLTHQSVLKDQSQSSSCEPPKASTILLLEPGPAWNRVGRYRQKGQGVSLHGCQKFSYQPSQIRPPKGSFCPVSFEPIEQDWIWCLPPKYSRNAAFDNRYCVYLPLNDLLCFWDLLLLSIRNKYCLTVTYNLIWLSVLKLFDKHPSHHPPKKPINSMKWAQTQAHRSKGQNEEPVINPRT